MSKYKRAIQTVPGSLQDYSDKTGKSLSMSYFNCKMIVICDTSGSMTWEDSRDGQSRYDVLTYELAGLQGNNPGDVAVVAFSGTGKIMWCENGVPYFFRGMTDMGYALDWVIDEMGVSKRKKVVLISDGEPDSERAALRAAKRYPVPIDTIYVGERGGRGRDFLERLAKATQGQHQDDFAVGQLEEKVTLLLADRVD